MAGTTTYFGISYPTSTDLVKDGAANMQTIATGFDSAVAIPTYNAQTGTTYTFALSDIGKTVTASNASASTYTIPPQSSVVWVANTTLNVTNLGAGVVTFAGGVGVTVTNTAQTLTQYQSAQLIRTASNAWTVVPTSGVASSPGLVLISTTSFSASASHSVNDVFSATYNTYKIIVRSTGTGSYPMNMRMRVGGADNSAASYNWAGQYQQYTTTTESGENGNGATSMQIGGVSSGRGLVSLDIDMPFEANPTSYAAAGFDGSYKRLYAGQHNVSTSFTGFTLIPGSPGTITGSVSVYGYKQ